MREWKTLMENSIHPRTNNATLLEDTRALLQNSWLDNDTEKRGAFGMQPVVKECKEWQGDTKSIDFPGQRALTTTARKSVWTRQYHLLKNGRGVFTVATVNLTPESNENPSQRTMQSKGLGTPWPRTIDIHWSLFRVSLTFPPLLEHETHSQPKPAPQPTKRHTILWWAQIVWRNPRSQARTRWRTLQSSSSSWHLPSYAKAI